MTFIANLALSGQHLDAVVGAHTVTNDSNSDYIFDLVSVISGDHAPTVSYCRDADASGDLSAGDFLLSDTDADLFPDTGLVAVGQTVEILIIYQIGFVSGFDPMGIATIVTTATSSVDTLVSQAVTDTVEVILAADLILVKNAAILTDPVNGASNPKAIPGAVASYTITVNNQGGRPADLKFSSDGGATFGYTPTPDGNGVDASVTDIRINPKGVFLPSSGAGNPGFNIVFRVRVD